MEFVPYFLSSLAVMLVAVWLIYDWEE